VAKTPDVVAKEILDKLAVTAPGFSLELGTPERKIVDAVAESISEAYIDQYLVGSLLDIESKGGLELEQWVGIFGFGRLQGRKASGVVRVELKNSNPQDLNLPSGSPFYTRQALPSSGNPMFFTTSQAIVIPAGSYVAEVPVECTVVGTAGNVPPDSVVYVGDILGATSVTNPQAFTGGVDIETDNELRQRFKDTFLRNVAGTEDWYLGLCYQNKNVRKAACFGPIRKYATQIAAGPNINLASYLAQDVKYAWPGDAHISVFKNLGQDTEAFYQPGIGQDFTWLAGPQPVFTWLSTGGITSGDIIDVEFEYTTRSSRNDPTKGITNKVDLFVNGSDPYIVTERTVIDNAVRLSSTVNDQLYTGNFARVGPSTGNPTAPNRFMRLGSTPVMSFPSTLVVNGTTYTQGTHYHLLRLAPEKLTNPNQTTLLAGSVYEVVGLEWEASPAPPSGSTTIPLTVNYTYNRVPEVLQAVVKTAKQITTDVMVHEASYAWLRIHLTVEYDRGYVVSQVNNAIEDRLKTYFDGMPFGSWMEVSDLMLAVHQVLGVDNVNLTVASDAGVGTAHGVKLYGNSADTVPYITHDNDFKLTDNQLPKFLGVTIRRKANR
jgi:uncharacterized phage protein gp47/JayE